MVDPRNHLNLPRRVRPHIQATALTKHLEQLTSHSDDAVVTAARATLQYIRKCEPLDARSFDKLYFEILRQGATLSHDAQLDAWHAVRDVGVGVYHALLRQFRRDVKTRRAARLRRERRARERREPAGS